MEYIKSYKDLLEFIDITRNILDSCKKSYKDIEKFLLKQGCPQGYPEGTSYMDYDCIHGSRKELHADAIQKLVVEMNRLGNMIFLQEEILKNLYDTKHETDSKLKDLQGLEFKIAYKKYKENKSLRTIWSELQDEGNNYSLSYIEKISAKL